MSRNPDLRSAALRVCRSPRHGRRQRVYSGAALVLLAASSLHAAGTPRGSRPDIGPEYFQQGVEYRIEARLDTATDRISGRMRLVYTNQSADTLETVWFNLIQNAYRPGSLNDARSQSEGDYSYHAVPEAELPGTTIESLTDGAGRPLARSEDDTLLRVDLARSLLPGMSETFEIDFETRFGKPKRRMAKGDDYYLAAQWYPQLAVFDATRGWNLDYHLGKEFYGDFGRYEWSITLPAHYIVDGSGILLNEAEMLPDSLKAKLDLRRFAHKPLGEPASVIIPPTTAEKTWRFLAEDVHNVAWCASPSFRLAETEWEGIRCIAIAREQHAAGWQNAAEVCRAYVSDFSTRWGRYRYPKMIVSDVESGMEYPMFTADGGVDPDYITLFGHEIAHNWFYGMIGSNETYRALLDEGFTNYICAVATDSIFGSASATMWRGWYARHFYPTMSNDFERNDLRYLRFVRAGYERDPLLTGSNDFDEYQSYRQVYQKTSIMLRQMEQMLGREAMSRVMRTYFERFCFQHPYPEDFRRTVEDVTGYDLEPYFDAWLQRAWTIDYAVRGVENHRSPEGGWTATIDLERKGRMAMPLDLRLDLADGSTQWVLVPGREGTLKQPPGWIIAERWNGWGQIRPRHRIEVPVRAKVRRVSIDPECRMVDLDRLDNRSGLLPKKRYHLDNLKVYTPSLDAIDVYARPTIRWNGVDGLKLGPRLKTGYLATEFTRDHHAEVALRYAPRSEVLEHDLFLEHRLRFFGPLTHGFVRSREADGRDLREIGFEDVRRVRLYEDPVHRLRLFYRHSRLRDADYLPDGQVWGRGGLRSLHGQYAFDWSRRTVRGTHLIDLESSAYGGTRDWAGARVESRFRWSGSRPVRLRLFGALEDGEVPPQYALRPGGASFFDAAERNWMLAAHRSLPVGSEERRLHVGGGANLRHLNQTHSGTGERVDRMIGLNLEQQAATPAFAKRLSVRGQSLWPQFYSFLGAAWLRGRTQESVGDSIFVRSLRVHGSDEDHPGGVHRRWSFRGEVGIGAYLPLVWIPSSLGDYTLRTDWTPITFDSRASGLRPWNAGGRNGATWVIGLGRAWE
ncbi:MAG: M1 family metallopeptidase [Candidatus Eisenbacteria bacterium]|nr:M1 family metallopeptidase [Candidatus Eisenbacteria bacterium]